MRRLATVLVVFLCFLLMEGVALVRASSVNELLQVLQEKGVLTEDEARAIAKESSQEAKTLKALKGLKIGTLTYLDYSIGRSNGKPGSKFSVTRSYFDVKKAITPWFAFRFTPDVTRKSDGDISLRVKYVYAQFKIPSAGFLTNMKAEVGQGHFPWLDFQEHINPYRCQGTMPRERAGTFNSADMGIGVMGYFGGKLPKYYVRELSTHYPVFSHYTGLYGSWHLGVYNGGGYHADEANNNKALEGRITIRPLGAMDSYLRGLQLSYFFIRGKGNQATNPPDFNVDLFMVSFQHPWFVVTAEYSTSKGNNKGSWVYKGRDLKTKLYSVFGDVTLPVLEEKLHAFARYDRFDPDKDNVVTNGAGKDNYTLYMAGLAYYFYKKNIFMITYEKTDYQENLAAGKWGHPYGGPSQISIGANAKDDYRLQAVLQVAF